MSEEPRHPVPPGLILRGLVGGQPNAAGRVTALDVGPGGRKRRGR